MRKKNLSTQDRNLFYFETILNKTRYIDDETMKLISDSLFQVSEETRIVVTYVIIKNRTFEMAAAEMGVSVDIIRMHFWQGMRALRVALKNKRELMFVLVLFSIYRNK